MSIDDYTRQIQESVLDLNMTLIDRVSAAIITNGLITPATTPEAAVQVYQNVFQALLATRPDPE